MLRSGSARTVCFIALVSTLFVLRNTECATAPEPGDLRGVGKVTFPITCAPDVQSDFARGVALLHSFFYEGARPEMRDGAMGNRHDVVASNLDAAHSGRNARRQSSH